ncbi:MAG: cis-prenyltransferase [Piccolia ochrophora]|nr:MAG: cis-prenyltransferase [Piccolia ochrophora]
MSSLHLSQIRNWIFASPPIEWAARQLRELLIGALRQGPIPQHVAFVMDGNRRFAKSHQIEVVEGHNLGSEALARILEVCYKSGVKVVTIYAFSIENFKRSKYEVDGLMGMAKLKLSQVIQHGDLLDRYGASIRFLGEREMVKPDVMKAIDRAVELTSHNKDAILNVCFPYTSRDEITTAIRDTVIDYSTPLEQQPQRPFSEARIARNILSQHPTTSPPQRASSPSPTSTSDAEEDSASSSTTLHPESRPSSEHGQPANPAFADPEKITIKTIEDHLYTAGNPPLDLLVRTSGVERLSDFMLWQCHQATEIVFLQCLWPEFDLWHFLPVLVEWQWRQRKSGEKAAGAGLPHAQSPKVVR